MRFDVGFHEGKACDAIVRILETRHKAKRENVRFPEMENHNAPVELTFTLNGELLAMEHTGIEPFAGHVELTALAKKCLQPVEELVAERTKFAEHVDLQIPESGLRNLKRTEITSVQRALADWVVESVPNTPISDYGRYVAPVVQHTIPGVPFPVLLHRFDALGNAGFFRVSVNLEAFDRDAERVKRIRKACDTKFPKLAAWKKSDGARTILVLEDNDIQFTSQSIVAEVVLPIAKAAHCRPDEIWLVMSCTDPWIVFPMLTGEKTYFEQTGSMIQIAPTKLESITSRSCAEKV